MVYFKDLLTKRKSKFALVLGIIFLVVSVSSIPIKLAEKNTLSTFDWIYFIVFFLNGIYWIIALGLGLQVERIFGKAYIRIDNEKIVFKTGVIEKLHEISWNEINSIEYNSSCFIIKRKNRSDYKIRVSNLEYSTIQEIKALVDEISQSKNISSAVY